MDLTNPDTFKNPYDILDDYVQHVCEKAKNTKLSSTQINKKQECDTSVMRAEIGLLQSQVYCLQSLYVSSCIFVQFGNEGHVFYFSHHQTSSHLVIVTR